MKCEEADTWCSLVGSYYQRGDSDHNWQYPHPPMFVAVRYENCVPAKRTPSDGQPSQRDGNQNQAG